MALQTISGIVVEFRTNTNDVKITWTASTESPDGYNIYRRPVPYGITIVDKVNTSLVVTNEYTETPPLILNNEWFYWITQEKGIEESSFQTEGVTWLPYTSFTGQTDLNYPYLPDNIGMDFYFDEIKRRHIWILYNDGEDITFYKRRWSGTRCSCVQETGEAGNFNCLECFGTGIKGGYYFGYTIKIRYGDLPRRLVRFESGGLEIQHRPPSWTLWTPKLAEHDLVVRFNTGGSRYDVNDIRQSEWRGLPLHQEFDLEELLPSDPRFLVNDTSIQAALDM